MELKFIMEDFGRGDDIVLLLTFLFKVLQFNLPQFNYENRLYTGVKLATGIIKKR